MAARDEPPSCLRQGRKFCFYTWAEACGRERMAHESVRLTAGKNCLFLKLVAGEASPAPPGRGLRPLPTPLKGALPPSPPNGGKYPPYPPLTGRVAPAGRAGPWPGWTGRLLACGKGGCVTAQDEPPSCLRQGRVRGRTGQAAFLPAARAESLILQLGRNTRTRAHDSHARASASGPKREEKFFAKLSFKKAGEAGEIGRGIGSGL